MEVPEELEKNGQMGSSGHHTSIHWHFKMTIYSLGQISRNYVNLG